MFCAVSEEPPRDQGMTWSTTVIMKIDLVGPARRGLALGLNEAAGYGALALTAFVTGLIAERWGLRPAPFLLGLAYAGLGLGLSALAVVWRVAHLEESTHAALGYSVPMIFPALAASLVCLITVSLLTPAPRQEQWRPFFRRPESELES